MRKYNKLSIIFAILLIIANINSVHAELETSIYPYDNLKIEYTRNGYEGGNEESNYRYFFPKSVFLSDIYAYDGTRVVYIKKNSDSTANYYIQANTTAFQFQYQLNNYSCDVIKLYPYLTSYGSSYACFTYLSLFFNTTIRTYQIKLFLELTGIYYYIDLDNSSDSVTITQQFAFNATQGFTYTLKEKEHFKELQIFDSSRIYDIGLFFRPSIIPYLVKEETYGTYYESGYCSSMLRVFRMVYSYKQEISTGFIDATIVEDSEQYLDISESTYWSYSSFSLKSDANNTINMTNFVVDYPLLEVDNQEQKFYYSTSTLAKDSWGHWGIFDWLRRGLLAIINSVIFIVQCVLYLLNLAFNYLIIGFFSYIIALIWNYVIFYVFYALCYIINIIYSFFIIAWNIVSAFFDSLITLLPISAEGIMNLFKTIGGFLILAFSYISTALLWAVSFGAVDFDELFLKVFSLTENLYLTINTAIMTFFEFLPALLIYAVFYINLLLLLYLKIIYCKFRGFTKRANELQTSLSGYLEIFRFAKSVIEFIRNLIPIV